MNTYILQHVHIMFSFFDGAISVTKVLFYFCCFRIKSSCELEMAADEIKHALEKSGIVPDVIDVFPKNILQIEYEDHNEVAFGNNMTRWVTFEEPVSITYPVDPDSHYAIIMTDPDCPSRENPIHREWQHWIVVNIPGANWTQGFCLSAYIGILGYYEHDVHRYVFLLYKQPGKLNFTETVLDPRPVEMLRYKFSTRKFAMKYKFGDPIAVNFFMSVEDPERPKITQTTPTE